MIKIDTNPDVLYEQTVLAARELREADIPAEESEPINVRITYIVYRHLRENIGQSEVGLKTLFQGILTGMGAPPGASEADKATVKEFLGQVYDKIREKIVDEVNNVAATILVNAVPDAAEKMKPHFFCEGSEGVVDEEKVNTCFAFMRWEKASLVYSAQTMMLQELAPIVGRDITPIVNGTMSKFLLSDEVDTLAQGFLSDAVSATLLGLKFAGSMIASLVQAESLVDSPR